MKIYLIHGSRRVKEDFTVRVTATSESEARGKVEEAGKSLDPLSIPGVDFFESEIDTTTPVQVFGVQVYDVAEAQ